MSKAKKDKDIDDANAEFDELAKQEAAEKVKKAEQIKDTSKPVKWEKDKIQKLNTGMMRIRQQKFLKAFAECGKILKSCQAAGINPYTEQRWRLNGDKWYIQQFKDAQETYKEKIGAIVEDRAIEGTKVPVIGKILVQTPDGHSAVVDGLLTDENGAPLYKRVYDSNLLMFYAKKVDPTFKEKHEEPRDTDKPSENTSPMTRITIQLNMMRERQNQRIIDVTPVRKELTDGQESTEVTLEESDG